MYLVFDAGGTFTKYAIMNNEGEIVEKGKFPTVPAENGNTAADFVEKAGEVYDDCKKKYDITGIAMSLPGQIDVEKGIVYGGGAIRYLDRVSLGGMISERCDNLRVALENDGKCAALAEVWLGNARDCNDAVVLVVGTGIGGGIILDRKVRRGKRLLAGELSYMLDDVKFEDIDNYYDIDKCSLEDAFESKAPFWSKYAATAGVCYYVAKKKGLPYSEVSGEKIYKWADEGDDISIRALEDMYITIAKQCMSLYVTLDPEIILIGGGISAEPRFIEGIKKYIEKLKVISEVYSELKVDLCKFQNDSNLLGALFNYMQLYEGAK